LRNGTTTASDISRQHTDRVGRRARFARWRQAALLTALCAVAGCTTTSIAVPTEPTQFPIPVLDKVPLVMGLNLPDELLSYEFREDLGDAGEFVIEIGDAQRPMFENLLTGMFDGYVLAPDPSAAPAGAAAVLVPRIAEMQFSTPQQTRTDYFEVWIRYQFQLYGRDGTVVGEWPLTAYGKANTQNYLLGAPSPALTQAALNACRDAMAFFTVQFRTVPAVQKWLRFELAQGGS